MSDTEVEETPGGAGGRGADAERCLKPAPAAEEAPAAVAAPTPEEVSDTAETEDETARG